jgi:Recombination endonuclease VII
MPVRSDITGEKFGKLTAIRPVGQSKTGKYIWLCSCDCGKERSVKIDNLTSGHTRSCGCLVSNRKQTSDEANAKRRATTAKWHASHKPQERIFRRDRAIKSHGLTRERYDSILKKQNGCCAICRLPSIYTLQIDHDHSCCPRTFSCGRCIRGLLCVACNRALGLFHDNPEMLKSAIAYLEGIGAVETVREAGANPKIQSELHGDVQSAAEMTVPVISPLN